MAHPPLTEHARELVARPNPAVMATLAPGGRPVTVATWYLLEEDGRVLLNLDGSRARLAHLRRDPRVSLTVLDGGDWYTHVSLQGTVSEPVPDEGLADIDRLSRHFVGGPYPDRESPRFSVHLTIERWSGWGATRAG